MRSRWTTAAALAAGAALFSGCGKPERLPTIPVSGKVTYEDGSLVPANGMELRLLTPQKLIDEGYPVAATARIDTRDGKFTEATTWEHGDGVMAGEHEVEVVRTGDEKDPGGIQAKAYRGDRVWPKKVSVDPDKPDSHVIHITIPRD